MTQKQSDKKSERLNGLVEDMLRVSQDVDMSPTSVFMADFRLRLDRVKARARRITFGEWCWRAVPVSALGTLLLAATFLVVGALQPAPVERTTADSDEALWTLIEEDSMERNPDEVIEAVLLRERE